ncbi:MULTISPECIES: flagellar biosynthesis protein FlhB [unclassified Methylophilus]|jgi:flagellar biosynthesis protein FlhB|uniref:flagellar biosynthesis protein FlhB n=1 Tax=unclassified Methylophilus TaxID=2630143 RepID=UPI00037F9662|nr:MULTISPECIES: flagellar biosynthesis protein FlhB [unclassified Methylophilus]HCU84879.1 flagellar type III secretion system protein FlhB [Methylophilus sp.]
MAAEDSDMEKTEDASPKRLEKAREDGDIPRSRELAACAVLFTTGMAIMMLSRPLGEAMKNVLRQGLSIDHAMAFEPQLLIVHMMKVVEQALWAFLPLAVIIVSVAVAAPILVGGWVMSQKSLVPNFGKLNPIKGLANLFSKNSLVELLKSIAKTILVASVGYTIVKKDLQPMLSLSQMPLAAGISTVSDYMVTGFLTIASALVLIAVIDVPYQLYQYAQKHKMTKQELKDEAKESEGSPEIKGRIRQQQREMARRRMMSNVPQADVVITNPTHYAVAIRYKEGENGAPIVVAKGADVIAQKIKEIAAEHEVMTLESPKLARALYAHAELEREIPQTLYAAVAEILAYVFQLRVFKQHGGVRPAMPANVPVPDALDPHALNAAPASAAVIE